MRAGLVGFILLELLFQTGSEGQTNVFRPRPSAQKLEVGKNVNITCGYEEMSVTLSSKFLEQNPYGISTIDKICFRDRKCCAEMVSDKIIVKISKDFAKCGNKISIKETLGESGSAEATHYEFENKLIYDGRSGSISRDILLVNFKCLYPAEMLVHATPRDSDVSSVEIKIKKVAGEIGVFKDEKYDQKYIGGEEKKDPVFVKITIQDPGVSSVVPSEDLNFVSVVRDCLVNDGEVDHQIIQDGCPIDAMSEIYATGSSLETDLRIDIGEIVPSDAQNATVRCLMNLCIKSQESNCQPTCLTRERRALADSTIQPQKQKYFLNFSGEEFSAFIQLNPKDTRDNSSTSTQVETKGIESKFDENFPMAIVFGAIALVLVLLIVTCAICLTRAERRREENKQ